MIELTKTKTSSSTSNTCPKVTHRVTSACSSRRKEWSYEVLSSLRPARESRKAAAFWNSVLGKIKGDVLIWMGKNAKAILWAFPIQTRGDLCVTIINRDQLPARPKQLDLQSRACGTCTGLFSHKLINDCLNTKRQRITLKSHSILLLNWYIFDQADLPYDIYKLLRLNLDKLLINRI